MKLLLASFLLAAMALATLQADDKKLPDDAKAQEFAKGSSSSVPHA